MSLPSARSFLRVPSVLLLALTLAVGSLLVTSPAQGQKIRPNFFGMHDSRISSGALPGVRIGAVRLWDTPGTSWRAIESLPSLYDFEDLDRAVATAESARIRPMVVLGQTPQFWAEDKLAPGAYGDGASSMPDIDAWKRYVGAVARQYGNRVDYQIWNEPNVVNYWTGSVQDMAKLTATASKVIRNVVGKKKATIVAPAFPLRLKGQRSWYNKYWSAKVGGKSMASFLKVVAVNLYPLDHQPPEAQTKLLAFAKRALPKAARRKPMWNTEINYGLRGGETAKEIPEAKQAAYVARTFALNAASPIRRMYWYAWRVGPIANTHLVNDDGTLTRAGKAWGVARGWLVGTNAKKCVKTKRGKLKGLYTCTASKGRREVRRIYWKPSGRKVRIATHKTTKRWSNLAGDTTARKGRYRLKVGMSPIMVASRR